MSMLTTGRSEAGVGGTAHADGRFRAADAALFIAWAVVGIFAVASLDLPIPGGIGVIVALVPVCVGLAVLAVRNPPFAAILLLAAMFLRLALPSVGADPFVLAFAGVLASMALWLWRQQGTAPGLSLVEGAMVLYVLWSMTSMILPHEYPPVLYPLDGSELAVPRFILISTVIPFTMYLLGRMAFERESAVRLVLWSVLGFGAYSTLVSVLQFHAPAFVWPRYIVDSPNWENRANGVFNQPVSNGIILVVGFAVALVLASDRSHRLWKRVALHLFAGAAGYAVFLTHTRAVYLGFGVVLVLGMLLAHRARISFALVFVAVVLVAVLNWSTFTSSDRSAGGIGSPNELHDRLNSMATALWAFEEKPWFGWGIGRFVAVNTFHHQQWSNDVPWIRGLGISSHLNELGILAELGLLGLGLWLAVMIPMTHRLILFYRMAPLGGLKGKRLAFVALSALVTLLLAGLSADLRLFDFPTAVVLLLVGMAAGERDRLQRGALPRRQPWASTPAAGRPGVRRPSMLSGDTP